MKALRAPSTIFRKDERDGTKDAERGPDEGTFRGEGGESSEPKTAKVEKTAAAEDGAAEEQERDPAIEEEDFY